jgi:hypothetical protein
VDVREPKDGSAYGSAEPDGPRIVTVCAELSDAAPLALSLEQLNKGSLLVYRRQSELKFNPPVGEINLFVLIDREFLEPTDETLHWLGRYWPGVIAAVVGGTGSGRQELIARMGGALYFVYPAYGGQWRSLVRLAVERTNRTDTPAA